MLVTFSILNNILQCWIKGSCFYLNLHIVSLFGIVPGCCACLTHSQPLSYILSTTTPTASIICLLDSDRLGIENRLLQDQLLSPGPYLDLCFSVQHLTRSITIIYHLLRYPNPDKQASSGSNFTSMRKAEQENPSVILK